MQTCERIMWCLDKNVYFSHILLVCRENYEKQMFLVAAITCIEVVLIATKATVIECNKARTTI